MTDRDPEIIEIQQDWLEQHGEHKRWMIVKTDDGYELHVHDRDSVSPTSTYPTKRLVASRLLQLLHIGPVAPQIEPETAEIGRLEVEEP